MIITLLCLMLYTKGTKFTEDSGTLFTIAALIEFFAFEVPLLAHFLQ